MANFRSTFPDESIPIKMHTLEDHATDWIRMNQRMGFGLIGEEGAESIHARFNRLYSTYCTVSSTTHPVDKLKYIMKEHLVYLPPSFQPDHLLARKPNYSNHKIHAHVDYLRVYVV